MNRREFVVAAASLVLAPSALANARGPVVLVTADEESRLVAVELARGHVLRHIATLGSPRSIETVGGTAVVAHSELGARPGRSSTRTTSAGLPKDGTYGSARASGSSSQSTPHERAVCSRGRTETGRRSTSRSLLDLLM